VSLVLRLRKNDAKMLTKEELRSLKDAMPEKYVSKVIRAYFEITGEPISRYTIFRFFAGKTYSIALHNATLHVAEKNREAISTLKKRTSDIINR